MWSFCMLQVQPPDLWIHHEQLELKGQSPLRDNQTPPYVAEATPYTSEITPYTSTSTLDRRHEDETDRLINRHSFKPKPLVVAPKEREFTYFLQIKSNVKSK